MVVKNNKLFWCQQKPEMKSMFLNAKLAKLEHQETDEIIRYLPNIKSKKVLELGAGIGRFTSHFAKDAKHVTTLDFNKSFLEENQRRNKQCNNISYIHSDVMDYNFEKDQFDFIFINWLFMYLEDTDLTHLKNHLFDSLKPNGYLFFRESCNVKKNVIHEDPYVNFRTLDFYSKLFDKKLKIVKSGYIIFYIYHAGSPTQYFWLLQK